MRLELSRMETELDVSIDTGEYVRSGGFHHTNTVESFSRLGRREDSISKRPPIRRRLHPTPQEKASSREKTNGNQIDI